MTRAAAGRALKLATAASSLFGVGVEVLRQPGLASALDMLSYFTIQSNLIVAAVCLAGALSRREESPAGSAWRGGAMLWITVTFLVYHFMLSSRHHPVGIYAASNLALHYLSPIALLADWAFLERKGRFAWRHALYWLGYPAAYVLFAEIRGASGGSYIYWFFDPVSPYPRGAGSPAAVALIVAGLALLLGLAGLALVAADRAAGRAADRAAGRAADRALTARDPRRS